jgi:hypothetical protein
VRASDLARLPQVPLLRWGGHWTTKAVGGPGISAGILNRMILDSEASGHS